MEVDTANVFVEFEKVSSLSFDRLISLKTVGRRTRVTRKGLYELFECMYTYI